MKSAKQGKRRMLRIFRNPKEKLSDNSFFHLILTSVASILLCCICLASLTWAWFTASVQSTSNKIASAQFYVSATVVCDGEAALNTSDENDIYSLKYALQSNKSYAVMITAHGTASQFGGYCEIILSDADGSNAASFFTVQLYPDQTDEISEITFTVNTSNTQNVLTIRPTWGEYAQGTTSADHSDLPQDLITNGSVIGDAIINRAAETRAATTAAEQSTVARTQAAATIAANTTAATTPTQAETIKVETTQAEHTAEATTAETVTAAAE